MTIWHDVNLLIIIIIIIIIIHCFIVHFGVTWCDAVEKLGSVKVEVPEVTQSEMGQKQKLREVLDMVNHLLNLTPSWVDQKWSVDSTLTLMYHLLAV